VSTALGSPTTPALGLTFTHGPLDGGLTLGVVALDGAPTTRPVVVLVDASGSLTGPPLAAAALFVERLVAGLGARASAVIAAGATPTIVRALGHAEPGPLAAPLARAGGGRADLARAATLATLLSEQAGQVVDVVLVTDLALDAQQVEAVRALERAGARLSVVLAASPRPGRAPLEPAARVDDPHALSSLLARLGPPLPAGSVEVALRRLPRAWFAWRDGRLEGGAPASATTVTRPLGDVVAFVLDAQQDAGPLGTATLTLAGGGAHRTLDLDLGRAGQVDPALVAALRLELGAAT
jgi:hypothetical protein